MNKMSFLEMAVQANNIDNYISIEEQEISDQNNPETIYLAIEQEKEKNKTFNCLSEEAKQVLKILFDCPKELVGIVTNNKSNKVNYKKILSYLRKKWGSRLLVKTLSLEIEKYAKLNSNNQTTLLVKKDDSKEICNALINTYNTNNTFFDDILDQNIKDLRNKNIKKLKIATNMFLVKVATQQQTTW